MPGALYQDALYNLIPIGDNEYISIMDWIKQQIKASKYGIIRLDAADLKFALGPEFWDKKDEKIYESLRNIMKKHKIKVRRKKENDGLTIILENQYKIDTLQNKIEILEKDNAMLKNKIATMLSERIEIVDKEDTK